MLRPQTWPKLVDLQRKLWDQAVWQTADFVMGTSLTADLAMGTSLAADFVMGTSLTADFAMGTSLIFQHGSTHVHDGRPDG